MQLCQILTDFQNFALLELRYVSILPWEIKNSHFLQIFSRQCRNANTTFGHHPHLILIASNFVVHPQILIFSVFKIASLSSY